MSRRTTQGLLVGLLLAAAAAFPAGALAATTPPPTLNVLQPGGTRAGSTASAALTLGFGTIAPSSLSINLPPGLLEPYNAGGDLCALSAVPLPACAIGTGTVTLGGAAVPMTLYLTAPPTANDLAGVTMTAGAYVIRGALDLPTAVSLSTLGPAVREAINFALPASPVMSGLIVTLSDLRMPTSCPSTPNQFVIYTTYFGSAANSVLVSRAPFPVTDCNKLSYSPLLSTVVHRDKGVNPSGAASLWSTLTVVPGQAATEEMLLAIPTTTVNINKALAPCVSGTQPCVVGNATLVSPLLPAASTAHGLMELSGTRRSPVLTLIFGPPTLLTLTGSVSLLGGTVSFSDLPDVPITTLTLRFTGNQLGRLYTTTCNPSLAGGKFYSASGAAPVSEKAAITFTGCPLKKVGRLTVTGGWFKGLAHGDPQLHLKAFRGEYGSDLQTVTVTAPAGLSFNASAIHGATALGLNLLNAASSQVNVRHGRLVIELRHPVRSVSVSVGAPLLRESASLRSRVAGGSVTRLTVGVGLETYSGVETHVKLTSPARYVAPQP